MPRHLVVNRYISNAMKVVFKDYTIREAKWYGEGVYTSIEIKIPNKWGCYLDFSYNGDIVLINYHGPCGGLKFKNVNVDSISDLESLLVLVNDYLDMVSNVENIKNLASDVGNAISHKRDKKIDSVI